MVIDLKNYLEVLRVIRAVDQSYRKHKAIVLAYHRIEMNDTYWSGGSRFSYHAVNLRTFQVGSAAQHAPPQFGGKTPVVDIPEGVVIVKVGTFCGKTAAATVYVNPDNLPKLLPGV